MSTTLLLMGSLAAATFTQSPVAPQSPSMLEAALLAADESATQPVDKQLHFTFTPGVYLARLGGESKLGPSPAAEDIDLGEDFDLDAMEPTFNFEMTVSKGPRWQLNASGFDFSTDASGTLDFAGVFGSVDFSPGDAYRASFDMTSLALSVSYWQWHPIDSAERGGSLDLRIGYGGGFRWLSVDQSLSLPGAAVAASGSGEWLIPEALLQLDFSYDLPESFPVLDGFEVLAMLGVGPAIGGDGGTVATLRVGMRFWIGRNFSADFGYRLIDAGVTNGDYELSGGLQGLFLSGTLRF